MQKGGILGKCLNTFVPHCRSRDENRSLKKGLRAVLCATDYNHVITFLFIVGMVPHRLHKVPPAKDPCKKCMFPKTFCSRDKNGTAECLCPQFCTREFSPVCGTDGRNYSNKCELEVEACKPENIRTLKVKHFGPCGK